MGKPVFRLSGRILFFAAGLIFIYYASFPSQGSAEEAEPGWGVLGAEIGFFSIPGGSTAYSKKLRVESQDDHYFFEFSLTSFDQDLKVHRDSSEGRLFLGAGIPAVQVGIGSYALYIRENITDVDHAFTVSRGGVIGKPATLVGRIVLLNAPAQKLRLTVTYSPHGWDHLAVDRPGWTVTGGRLITTELNFFQVMSSSFKLGLSGYVYNFDADIRSETGEKDNFSTTFYGFGVIASF